MNYLKERDGDLFSNADLKQLIVPLLIEQLLAIAVGMADSIMVSSVGEAAVSSVSLIDTIFILLINMFTRLQPAEPSCAASISERSGRIKHVRQLTSFCW